MADAFSPEQFGPYLLLSHLGRGGMADVYKARVEGVKGFARHVVVKRILKVHTQEPHFVEMFVNEAKIAARLSHSNIVQVYELGEVEGELFMAMEYVRGQDLLRVMRAAAIAGEPLPPSVIAAFVVREIARALSHAHEHVDETGAPRPIIHRDISPQNVMLSYDGQVKLVDFGIAKAVTAYHDVTHTGSLKGKFGYMAPEQIDTGVCTAQTDIFSVGVVLHEILTGRRLFKGQTDYDTMSRVKQSPLLPPSSIVQTTPPALDRITMTALDRDPARRYQRAGQLARDLDEFLAEARFVPDDLRTWLGRILPKEPREDGESQIAVLQGPGTPSRSGRSAGSVPSTSRNRPRPLLPDQQSSLGDMGGLVASPSPSPSYTSAGEVGAKAPAVTLQSAVVPQRGRTLLFVGVAFLFVTSLGGVLWVLRPPPQVPGSLKVATNQGQRQSPPPELSNKTNEGVQRIQVTLAKQEVRTEPPGAMVYAGPRRLGQTPLSVHLEEDSMDLVLSYAGRPDLKYTLRRTDGDTVTLRLPDVDPQRKRRNDRHKGKDPVKAAVQDQPVVQPPTPQQPESKAERRNLNVRIIEDDDKPHKDKGGAKVIDD